MTSPVTASVSSAITETDNVEAKSEPADLESIGSVPSPPTDDAVTAALVALSDFMRQSAAGQRALKRTEDMNRVKHQKAEAGELREKASDIRSGAIVSGAMLAASASLSLGSLLISDKGTSEFFSAIASPTAKGADVSEKLAEAASIEHQANATEESALADQARAHAEDAKANAEDAMSVLKKATDAIQAIQDSQAQF
jgi:hypothetical protein